MTIVHDPNKSRSPVRTRHHPAPQSVLACCPDHEGLLADLEIDAFTDPDIAALLPRARYLLTGITSPNDSGEVPWWAR